MRREGVVTVLIADNDKIFAKNLRDSIVIGGDIDVVSITYNGEDTLEKIIELKPDIALVDLVMPINDGLWILEELAELKFTQTGVIAMSCFENDTISQMAVDLGAKYFMVKPFNYVNLKRRIIQINKTMKEYRDRNDIVTKPAQVVEEKAEEPEKDVEYIISDIIGRLGIAPSLKGYHYIRSSVLIMLKEGDTAIGITKRIYPDVAKIYKTSPGKVERAMRHAVDSSWKKEDGEAYTEIFGYHFIKKPTNGQILANIAEYVKLNYLKL